MRKVIFILWIFALAIQAAAVPSQPIRAKNIVFEIGGTSQTVILSGLSTATAKRTLYLPDESSTIATHLYVAAALGEGFWTEVEIANSEFTDDLSGWLSTPEGEWSWYQDGRAWAPYATAASLECDPALTIEAGATYRVTVDVTEDAQSNQLYVKVGGADWQALETGQNVIAFPNVPDTGNLVFGVDGSGGSDHESYIDNVVLEKEVLSQDLNTLASVTSPTEGSTFIGTMNGHTLKDTLRYIINRGTMTGLETTVTSGLGISWAAGDLYCIATKTVVNISSGTGTCADDVVNYLVWPGCPATTLSLRTTAASGDEVPVSVIPCQSGAVISAEQVLYLNEVTAGIRRGLRSIFPVIVTDGLIVSEDADATNVWDTSCSPGTFFLFGSKEFSEAATVLSRTTATRRWFHVGATWSSDTNAQIDVTKYDNGTTLVAVTANKYYKSLFLRQNGVVHWIYPQAEYGTEAAGLAAPLPTIPAGLGLYPKVTAIVLKGGATAFPVSGSQAWIDVRPRLGGAVATTIQDHGSLSGLTGNDHPQYRLVADVPTTNPYAVGGLTNSGATTGVGAYYSGAMRVQTGLGVGIIPGTAGTIKVANYVWSTKAASNTVGAGSYYFASTGNGLRVGTDNSFNVDLYDGVSGRNTFAVATNGIAWSQGLRLGTGTGTAPTTGGLAMSGDLNCSGTVTAPTIVADVFVDRTPFYDGTSTAALAAVAAIKADAKGDLDHSSLPAFAQTKVRQTFEREITKDTPAIVPGGIVVRVTEKSRIVPAAYDEKGDMTETTRTMRLQDVTEERDGRDIGAMISIQAVAIKQLKIRSEEQQAEIAQLRQMLKDHIAGR